MLYIGVLFALTLLVAGHNEPGGGFIAGAMAASVFALLYVVFGRGYVESRFRRDYRDLTAVGLILLVGFAILPVLFGRPVLSNLLLDIDVGLFLEVPFFGRIPVADEIKLSSSLGFDLGVFFVVLGSVLTILRRAAGGETAG